jgi:hypothetical protein
VFNLFSIIQYVIELGEWDRDREVRIALAELARRKVVKIKDQFMVLIYRIFIGGSERLDISVGSFHNDGDQHTCD